MEYAMNDALIFACDFVNITHCDQCTSLTGKFSFHKPLRLSLPVKLL